MTNGDLTGVSASTEPPVVAITGASGYLGSILNEAFASGGFSVRRLVRSPSPGSGDRLFRLDSAGPSAALEGVDILIHCAYDMTLTQRADIWQTNVFGTTALFDMAISAGVRRTIAVSSMSAYPGTRQLYGRAKLETELAALSRGMCVVRPGLVYGPSWGGMAGTLRRLAAFPVLPDFGPKAYQFTVREDDLSAAVVALAVADEPPTCPVGIAHPDPVPFAALLASFAGTMGKSQPRFVPVPPMAVYGALRAAEFLSVKLPVRADSLLGLVRPAPYVPNLNILDEYSVVLHPFPMTEAAGERTDGSEVAHPGSECRTIE
jgi:nucleoside-diphosphate-sugar epimerase